MYVICKMLVQLNIRKKHIQTIYQKKNLRLYDLSEMCYEIAETKRTDVPPELSLEWFYSNHRYKIVALHKISSFMYLVPLNGRGPNTINTI
jgi:hypothetical protein